MTPREFAEVAIEDASSGYEPPYRQFLASGEPYRSLMRHNPWMKVPRAGEALEWGAGHYYDTTVARKHLDWMDKDLPQATRDISRLRRDFYAWGYCLIEDGLSAEQCAWLHDRVADQAAAERTLGLAHLSAAQQHVWALVNKGDRFVGCMEFDPAAVQSGLLIERLLDEAMGPGWNHFSFLANISYPGCHPQGLHQDQSFIAPCFTAEAPVLVNPIYILQDVDEVNGGTLLIPGSHRPNGQAGEAFGRLPPPINLEARAGTVLLMDGRVLHGGAVNRSDRLRYIITNSVVKPWIRQQESFLLTVSSEVLAQASDKFLWRAGFQATSTRNMVEGYGYTGTGKVGDPNGDIAQVRRAMDAGGYRHMGPLSMARLADVDPADLGAGRIQANHETYRSARYAERLRGIAS